MNENPIQDKEKEILADVAERCGELIQIPNLANKVVQPCIALRASDLDAFRKTMLQLDGTKSFAKFGTAMEAAEQVVNFSDEVDFQFTKDLYMLAKATDFDFHTMLCKIIESTGIKVVPFIPRNEDNWERDAAPGTADYQHGPIKNVDKMEVKIARMNEATRSRAEWPYAGILLDPIRSTVSVFDPNDLMRVYKAIQQGQSAGPWAGCYKIERIKNKFSKSHDPKKNPIRSMHLNISFKPLVPKDAPELPEYMTIVGEVQLQMMATTYLKKAQHRLYSIVRVAKTSSPYEALMKSM